MTKYNDACAHKFQISGLLNNTALQHLYLIRTSQIVQSIELFDYSVHLHFIANMLRKCLFYNLKINNRKNVQVQYATAWIHAYTYEEKKIIQIYAKIFR